MIRIVRLGRYIRWSLRAMRFMREEAPKGLWEHLMIYAATSIWLVLIVLLAWAVHRLWGQIAKPPAIKMAIFPGTLAANLGRIVGLLITGAQIDRSNFLEDDQPQNGPPASTAYAPKIPFFGPIVVGFLPMAFCGVLLYILLKRFGMPLVQAIPQEEISQHLPATLSDMWEQLRALITLAEGTLNAVTQIESWSWHLVLFIYLMISLTVRLAPFEGNVRGHLGAIFAGCGILALAGTMSQHPAEMIHQAWPLISLTIGWLLLLVMFSLVARGTVSTIRMIINWK